MKTYADKWKCPHGHENTTVRRVASAGKKVTSCCTAKACQWKRYAIVAGRLPRAKP